MALTSHDSDQYRDFAFAAADLLVSIDGNGRILQAIGDAHLMHHPSTDRLLGLDALTLISEGEASRLRQELWALAPGRRIAWQDVHSIDGGRTIVARHNAGEPGRFSLALSRTPSIGRVRGDSASELLADRFREIVMNGRLMAARQPVVALRTGQVSHYEVLARFNGDESPSGLISAAEKSGQISHLDYVMVAAASARLQGQPDPAFRLAVNISGDSIQNVSVVEELCAVITGHAFDRSRLILEITESAEIEDIETASRAVTMLRDSGISVALDDFGAGAASFNYLRSLDVDSLKFDGSFLKASTMNNRTQALLRNISRMCAELNISSVGERVETQGELRFLQETGVRYAQGYLFGQPRIDEDFFVRRRTSAKNAA